MHSIESKNLIEVFIQSEAHSNRRLIVNETTLKIQREKTLPLEHPWPYGFILNTLAEDGDGLDCFVIIDTPLKAGSIVRCEPVGILEMWEGQEPDPKILAVPNGESAELPGETHSTLSLFLFNLFTHFPDTVLRIGEILPASVAQELIQVSKHTNSATQAIAPRVYRRGAPVYQQVSAGSANAPPRSLSSQKGTGMTDQHRASTNSPLTGT
jgi:inorganic pyrophosphatase